MASLMMALRSRSRAAASSSTAARFPTAIRSEIVSLLILQIPYAPYGVSDRNPSCRIHPAPCNWCVFVPTSWERVETDSVSVQFFWELDIGDRTTAAVREGRHDHRPVARDHT